MNGSSSRLGSANEAILTVSRLLSVAMEHGSALAVHEALVREAKAFFRVREAALVEVVGTRSVRLVAGGRVEAGAVRVIPEGCVVQELLDRRQRSLVLSGDDARQMTLLGDHANDAGAALLLVLRPPGDEPHILVLADPDPGFVRSERVMLGASFATAAAAALGQNRMNAEHERRVAHQSALTRAAKNLNESLDLRTLLARICLEAATILDADAASVFRGRDDGWMTVEAVFGLAPETVGFEVPPGGGLSGRALHADRAMLTNEYRRVAKLPENSPFGDVHSAMAVPMHWDGELRGVLAVSYTRPYRVSEEHLKVLETFAELAAVACRNASTRAGLALAARTDGLTGCLNHAALHETLAREIERSERTGGTLGLVLIDLDDFKQVNEAHGHLVGDELLRRAGHALRTSTRPYDVAARYGGDEFALLAVDADERAACEIAERAIERLSVAVGELDDDGRTYATAGVCQWTPGTSATELIARADRALLHGKQQGFRGIPVAFTSLPEKTAPRFQRPRPTGSRHAPPPAAPIPAAAAGLGWPSRTEADERLLKRTRQLALANALGAQVSAMTDPRAIVEAAAEELHNAFGYFCVAVVRLRADGTIESAAGRGEAFRRLTDANWRQPADEGLIGRCLSTRRPVVANDVFAEPDYRITPETLEVQSELAVPVWVGGELWGAINIEEVRLGAFDDDDARLVQTVAGQVGSALRSASLFQQLERAYLGTAEALAAALEAKDSYTAQHAHSIVAWAEAVGRRLGMEERDLRDLRFGAVFHDIGKIAVPEAILNKGGPLTDEERRHMERHTVAGEQILAPVEFLERVRPLVRHEHERWDGRGYPDGLTGPQIPLGARVILACDAYHAMTSDRPYRPAMDPSEARRELRRNAGTQFDARVVEALLDVLAAEDARAAQRVAPPRSTTMDTARDA